MLSTSEKRMAPNLPKDLDVLKGVLIKALGYKVRNITMNYEKKEIVCILYDAFIFECGFYDRYDVFGGGLLLDGASITTTFLGKSIALASKEHSIIEAFEHVDAYCRNRLPGKYLTAYNNVYLKENTQGGEI